MEKGQVNEWAEAQKITVSVDLVEAARTHLNFLAAVEERNRFLYEDNVLESAIYRYNAFWLPLLAKHSEKPVSEETLVVPLDCELIWHCHRLNPMRYKFDCEKLFGRVLGNSEVVSSLKGASKCTTEKIWNEIYPEEPYELDLTRPFSEDVLQNGSQNAKFTSYDLISAVKRQMKFTYQACRPYMSDELYLREAEARYKGFLHIVRTNRKMGQKRFSVPTYDIDLMWHTHQLYPESYYKDTIELVGNVVQHNDADPDKSKGSRLNTGFVETTKQWEQLFGSSYWKAGALNRGDKPTPVTQVPYEFFVEDKEFNKNEKCGLPIQFPSAKSVEVLLEFVDIKNLPEENKEKLLVAFSKNQPDKLFNTKRWLGISSASKEKLFDFFQCEPNGDFLFELMSNPPTSEELKPNKSMNLLGSCSLSVEQLMASRSQLTVNKWVSIDLVSGPGNSDPLLHVSMSFSPPMTAPQVFQLGKTHTFENDQVLTHVIDDSGKKVFSLQKRYIAKNATKSPSDLLTEVYCISDSGEKHVLVECHGDYWSLKGTHGSFKIQTNSGKDDSLFELVGYKMVKIFPGRRLEFELKHSKNEESEQDFATAVEFSTDYPYGMAVALINSKSGTIKAIGESMILPGIALTFILSNTTRRDDQSDIVTYGVDMVKNEGSQCTMTKCACQCGGCTPGGGGVLELVKETTQMDAGMFKSGLMKNEEYGAQCIGQCTKCKCDDDPEAVIDMMDAAGMFKPASMKNGEYGAQCIGQCTKCKCDDDPEAVIDMMDAAGMFKPASMKNGEYGAQCIGQCTKCKCDDDPETVIETMDVGMFKPAWMKNGEYGAQCIGQCTKCKCDDDPEAVINTMDAGMFKSPLMTNEVMEVGA